ncbi:MAG: hypothetical protein M9904_04510 [Chitinophagaceae bacterium]|nr:hypothetical protein [Chitinophagaceae bacterium]
MKSANLLTIGCLCLAISGFCQTTHSPLVSYYPSSGAYSKKFQNAFSVISNIGALSDLDHPAAGVYGEKKFMLSETGLYTAVGTVPAISGNFALQTDYFGYADYNESQMGIAYGLPLNEHIGVAAKFNYYHLRIPSYLSASGVNFEIGSVIHISDQLHTGVSVYNPLNSALGKNSSERIAAVYKAGIGYEISASFFTQVEVIKETGANVNIHTAFQYKPIMQLLVSAGMFSGTSSGYCGVGFFYRQMRIDLSVSFHQQLGYSTGLLLLYQWNKPGKE